MQILTHRVYEEPQPEGYRVLVDCLWPRGLTKREAALDEWNKDLPPSPALRRWFAHKPENWEEFTRKYLRELSNHTREAQTLLTRAQLHQPLILLYAAKDTQHTHALVLKQFLQKVS